MSTTAQTELGTTSGYMSAIAQTELGTTSGYMSAIAQTELGTTSGYMSTTAALTSVCYVAVDPVRLRSCTNKLHIVYHIPCSVEDSHSTVDHGPLCGLTFMKQAQITGYWFSTVCADAVTLV
jgi:hypothetical protein